MGSMKNWMLGAAMVAGAAGLGAAQAQAAEFGFHMRGPVAFVPPCPGPGYVWVAGYMANGYWVPGSPSRNGPNREAVRCEGCQIGTFFRRLTRFQTGRSKRLPVSKRVTALLCLPSFRR